MGSGGESAGSVTEMQVVSVGVGDQERASALVCLQPDLYRSRVCQSLVITEPNEQGGQTDLSMSITNIEHGDL